MTKTLRFWILVLLLSACHNRGSQTASMGENSNEDSAIILIRNEIQNAARLPHVAINPAYFILMTESKPDGRSGLLAYPVNCPESDANEVLQLFGLNKAMASQTSFSVSDLKKRFAADKQPILECSAVHAHSNQNEIVAVFRLQDPSGKLEQKDPSYYLKLRGFSEHVYQVGCREILSAFSPDRSQAISLLENAIAIKDPHVIPFLPDNGTFSDEGTRSVGVRRLACRAPSTALPEP